jgi:hypothetical protein
MPSGRALSLSPVCGFGAGQRVCKIVERERESESMKWWLFVWVALCVGKKLLCLSEGFRPALH